MGANIWGTHIKYFYKLVSVTKGNLFVSSASSIDPTRDLFLDTTRGLKTPQTAALTTTFTAPENNFLE